MLKYLCLALLLALSSAKYYESFVGDVRSLQINDCDPKLDSCTIEKGEIVITTITFVSKENCEKPRIHVFTELLGIQVDIANCDACSCNYISCPPGLVKDVDTNVTMSFSENVTSTIPSNLQDEYVVTAKMSCMDVLHDLLCVKFNMDVQ